MAGKKTKSPKQISPGIFPLTDFPWQISPNGFPLTDRYEKSPVRNMNIVLKFAISDVPFNCQDGGGEVEGGSQGGREQRGRAGGKGGGASCSANCTLQTDNCTLCHWQDVCSSIDR